MITPDEHAWLTAIAREPADRVRWLIFADWLEERGDQRAEAVRACGSGVEFLAFFLLPEFAPVLAEPVKAMISTVQVAAQVVAGFVELFGSQLARASRGA